MFWDVREKTGKGSNSIKLKLFLKKNMWSWFFFFKWTGYWRTCLLVALYFLWMRLNCCLGPISLQANHVAKQQKFKIARLIVKIFWAEKLLPTTQKIFKPQYPILLLNHYFQSKPIQFKSCVSDQQTLYCMHNHISTKA